MCESSSFVGAHLMSCPPFFLFSLRFSLIPRTYTVPCLSTYCSTSDVVQPQTSQTCSRHSARVLGQSGGDLAPQAEGVTQQLQHSWPALAAFVLAWSLTRHRTQGGLRECVGVLHYTGTAPVRSEPHTSTVFVLYLFLSLVRTRYTGSSCSPWVRSQSEERSG